MKMTNEEIYESVMGHKPNKDFGIKGPFSWNDIDALMNEAKREEKKVMSREPMIKIKDKDITTIEALHDVLLDEKVLGLNARCMRESRDLTNRMYKVLQNAPF
jgi:hypothetical protein